LLWCFSLTSIVQFGHQHTEHTEGTSEHEAEENESSVAKVPPPAQSPRSEFAIWLEREIRDVPFEVPIRALLLLDVKVCSRAFALEWTVLYMVLLSNQMQWAKSNPLYAALSSPTTADCQVALLMMPSPPCLLAIILFIDIALVPCQ
jgi:hypothetical protein